MEDLKVYTDDELQKELERLDTLLTRKQHRPANLTVRRDAIVAEIASRET